MKPHQGTFGLQPPWQRVFSNAFAVSSMDLTCQPDESSTEFRAVLRPLPLYEAIVPIPRANVANRYREVCFEVAPPHPLRIAAHARSEHRGCESSHSKYLECAPLVS